MVFSDYELMQQRSQQVFTEFKDNVRGWAPNDVADLLEVARLDWLADLTKIIDMWKHKAISEMNEGELLLAYATMGALVEGWLKLFYCVYYNDYKSDQKAIRDRKTAVLVTPNDLKFEQLKIFSRAILWPQGDVFDKWVEKIQQRRNAIHAFNNRDIGTKEEFISDIEIYCRFIAEIDTRLPDMPI